MSYSSRKYSSNDKNAYISFSSVSVKMFTGDVTIRMSIYRWRHYLEDEPNQNLVRLEMAEISRSEVLFWAASSKQTVNYF